MHFASTLPAGTPELMRVSAFQRQAETSREARAPDTISSRASLLGPSLMQDLMRFDKLGCPSEPLEVLAACVRHGRSLLLHLQIGERVLPLTVLPKDGLVHSPVPMAQVLDWPLSDLRVLNVEPSALKAPGAGRGDGTMAQEFSALSPLMWELALRGSRAGLLPEISGHAAYRIVPGVDLEALPLTGTMAQAVQRLQRHTCGLREIAAWPGFDRERAARMLNGLYLQAGLMVTRSHPAASGEVRGAGDLN